MDNPFDTVRAGIAAENVSANPFDHVTPVAVEPTPTREASPAELTGVMGKPQAELTPKQRGHYSPEEVRTEANRQAGELVQKSGDTFDPNGPEAPGGAMFAFKVGRNFEQGGMKAA